MSAAVAAILEGMPEPRDLRMHEHDGRCVITAGSVVLFEYDAGDILMRNMALVALRRLGFPGQVVAQLPGLSASYVSTLFAAAKREGSAALAGQQRRGAPGTVSESTSASPRRAAGSCRRTWTPSHCGMSSCARPIHRPRCRPTVSSLPIRASSMKDGRGKRGRPRS